MLQRRGRLDLDDEPLGAQHRGELRLQDFDRDLAIVLEVVREVDGRHSALAEFALDAIAAGERCGEEVGLCHLRPIPRSSWPKLDTTVICRAAVIPCGSAMAKRLPSGKTST